MNYHQDKIRYFSDLLTKHGFYVARKTITNDYVSCYMISARDWRHTLILKCDRLSIFRLSVLYVTEDDIFSFTEETFQNLVSQLSASRVLTT